jgi:hypothetical protein
VHENTGIIRREGRTGEICAGERDVDGGSCIAGVWRKGRDRRGPASAGIVCDREVIPDGVVLTAPVPGETSPHSGDGLTNAPGSSDGGQRQWRRQLS